jgi:hypothetical protein
VSFPQLPVEAVANGVRVTLRVTPRASRNRIDGVRLDAAGRAHLMVRVTAPPERGKANAAVVRLLAKAWRVPPSRLSVVAGAAGRRKTVHVAGDASRLVERLGDWAARADA